MGFDDLVDCSSFVSSAIGQMGCNADVYGHAVGELSKAMRGSSLPVRQATQSTVKSIIMMSIVRKSSLPERQSTKEVTLTVDNVKIDWDVLEKNFGPLNKGDIVFHKDGWNFT